MKERIREFELDKLALVGHRHLDSTIISTIDIDITSTTIAVNPAPYDGEELPFVDVSLPLEVVLNDDYSCTFMCDGAETYPPASDLRESEQPLINAIAATISDLWVKHSGDIPLPRRRSRIKRHYDELFESFKTKLKMSDSFYTKWRKHTIMGLDNYS